MGRASRPFVVGCYQINFLASATIFNSSSSAFFRSSQACPSGVAKNLRAWILRLLRLVAAEFFAMIASSSARSWATKAGYKKAH